MYGSRAMLGTGGFTDNYDMIGTKRHRMMDSTPYLSTGPTFDPSSLPVVRLRGLPFDCTEIDIVNFFTGLDIIDALLINKNGRFTGESIVLFSTPIQSEFALQRDRQNMGRRYIEVFPCTKRDYYRAITADVDEYCERESPPAKRSKPKSSKKVEVDKEEMDYTDVIKMRGLPYSVTKADIVEFFDEFEVSEDNVCIGYRADGKATGEAFVEFESVEEAKKAMGKDKMTIGSRYVELFPSAPEDKRRAESRASR